MTRIAEEIAAEIPPPSSRTDQSDTAAVGAAAATDNDDLELIRDSAGRLEAALPQDDEILKKKKEGTASSNKKVVDNKDTVLKKDAKSSVISYALDDDSSSHNNLKTKKVVDDNVKIGKGKSSALSYALDDSGTEHDRTTKGIGGGQNNNPVPPQLSRGNGRGVAARGSSTPGAYPINTGSNTGPAVATTQDDNNGPTNLDSGSGGELPDLDPEEGGGESGLVQANPVSETFLDLPNATEYHPQQPQEQHPDDESKRRHQKLSSENQNTIRIIVPLFVVAAIVLVVMLIVLLRDNNNGQDSSENSNNNNPESLSSSSSPAAPNDINDYDYVFGMLPEYTQMELLQPKRKDSPQSKAMEWILKDPNLRLYNNNNNNNETTTTTTTNRILQRFSLATLYFACAGEQWFVNTNWLNHSIHECYWSQKESFHEVQYDVREYITAVYPNPCEVPPNITLDNVNSIDKNNNSNRKQNEDIVHLWLSPNNLVGELPPEVFELTSLRSMALSSNQDLDIVIPPTLIGQLTQLEVFYGGGTKLHGTIPSQLGLLSNSLSHLILSNTQITGTIPTQLGYLHNKLHTIMFDYCLLSGTIPSQFGLATNLVTFNMNTNGMISGTLPTELGQLSNANMLLFKDNQVSGRIPSQLGLLTKMNYLLGSGNALTGPLPGELFNTPLYEMRVGNNQLSGTIPTEVALAPDNYWLSLHTNMFTGTIPSEIALISYLHILHLYDNRLSGEIPTQLGPMVVNGYLDNAGFEGNQLLSGTVPAELCYLGLLEDHNYIKNNQYNIPNKNGVSFDCGGNGSQPLCGCCWCPCSLDNNNTTNDDDDDNNNITTLATLLDADAACPSTPTWPGLFPSPVNATNVVTVNIHKDMWEIGWVWSTGSSANSSASDHDEEDGWQVLEESGFDLPRNIITDENGGGYYNTLHSYTFHVNSSSTYQLKVIDPWCDGILHPGWITVNTVKAEPSADEGSPLAEEGTILYSLLGGDGVFGCELLVKLIVTTEGEVQLLGTTGSDSTHGWIPPEFLTNNNSTD